MSTEHGEAPYSLLPPGLSRSGLLDLYRVLARGRELERVLAGDPPASPATFPPLAALAAVWPLRRSSEGSGDLLGMTIRSPVAALGHGLSPRALLQGSHRPPVPASGRDAGGDWIDLPHGLLAPEAPPGVLLGVMAGATLAFRFQDEPRAGLFLGGVAGSASGAWHEGLNLAAVQRSPLVVVVLTRPGDPSPSPGRTPAGASSPVDRGLPYGIGSQAVEGDDLPGTLEAVSSALERARDGGGVTLIEVRWDPGTALGDPTSAFRARLGQLDPAMAEEISAIDAAARTEMEEAARLGPHAPVPHGESPTRGSFHRPVPRVSPLAGA